MHAESPAFTRGEQVVARMQGDISEAAPVREPLRGRRAQELVSFEHGGMHYTAGIGRFDDGRIAEIFLSSDKAGSNAADLARDAAITASLALQHGCPLSTLRHALTRAQDGTAAGPIGTVLDMLGGDGA
jgi:hypothetical protein